MAEDWRTGDVGVLCRALLAMRDEQEMAALLRDLCTLAELEALGHRLAAARLVDDGVPYHDVAARVGTSTTTVTRVAHWLRHGEGGYRLALQRLDDAARSPAPPPAGRPATGTPAGTTASAPTVSASTASAPVPSAPTASATPAASPATEDHP